MKTKYLFTVLSSLVLAVAVSTISVEAKAQVRPPKVVVALLDETLSFPYFEESKQKMARVLVPELEGGDQFLLLAISENGFRDKDLLLQVQMPQPSGRHIDPTFRNRLYLARQQVAQAILGLPFLKYRKTDLKGSLFYAAKLLADSPLTEKHLLVFSDLEDNVAQRIEPKQLRLSGVKVTALFVSHKEGDIEAFDTKQQRWKEFLTQAGAQELRSLDPAQSHSIVALTK